MLQLVQVVTADGIRLDGVLEGALETPSAQLAADQPSLAVVDAWLLLHGTGSNFYSGALLGGLATRLAGGSATVLRVNTRGHDQVSAAYTPRGPRWIGAAFERVADSPLDIAAWIKLLIERGHQRIGILGHSLGAVKAIYALNQFHGGNQVDSPEQQAEPADLTPLRNVVALAAVSPPRLSYSHYAASIRSSVFLPIFERAAALVAAGQSDTLLEVNFPLRYIVSAGAYVDRYGPPERYNVLNLLGGLPCPTLVSYGSLELQTDAAFAGMPEAIEQIRQQAAAANQSPRLQTAIVAGADHLYSAAQDGLLASLERWLRKLPQPS